MKLTNPPPTITEITDLYIITSLRRCDELVKRRDIIYRHILRMSFLLWFTERCCLYLSPCNAWKVLNADLKRNNDGLIEILMD
jgi:hypothetical protein